MSAVEYFFIGETQTAYHLNLLPHAEEDSGQAGQVDWALVFPSL